MEMQKWDETWIVELRCSLNHISFKGVFVSFEYIIIFLSFDKNKLLTKCAYIYTFICFKIIRTTSVPERVFGKTITVFEILNCLCNHTDLYTIGCTIELPFIWFNKKCMLVWKTCFYFSSVLLVCSSKLRTRRKRCSRARTFSTPAILLHSRLGGQTACADPFHRIWIRPYTRRLGPDS